MLVDRAPQEVDRAGEPEDDFLERPCVARPGPAPAQPVGVDLAERRAPLPDGFLADHDAALHHQLLDLTKAPREPVIQPHAVRVQTASHKLCSGVVGFCTNWGLTRVAHL
jgi:hypothetical protein